MNKKHETPKEALKRIEVFRPKALAYVMRLSPAELFIMRDMINQLNAVSVSKELVNAVILYRAYQIEEELMDFDAAAVVPRKLQ